MPLLDDLAFNLNDERYGTQIPYMPHYLVENGYAGPSGNMGYETGSSITETYIVPWKYLQRFCQLAVGENYVDNSVLKRSMPLFYSGVFEDGYFGNLYCTAIQAIKGIPGPDPYVTDTLGDYVTRPSSATDNDTPVLLGSYYAYASVTLGFSPLPYILREDQYTPTTKEWLRFTTVQRTPRVEFLQVDGGSYYWIDNPVVARQSPVPYKLPIRDQSIDYVVTWHRVPFCITDIDAYMAYANSEDEFLKGHPQCPTNGFAKDTMLLLGMQETLIPNPWDANYMFDPDDDADTIQLYTYAFFFQHKANGHNAGLRRWIPQTGPDKNKMSLMYNPFSLDGTVPQANNQRVIKQTAMTNLFAAR